MANKAVNVATYDELMEKVLQIFPSAYAVEGIDGELIIETGYKYDRDEGAYLEHEEDM